MRIDVLEDDDSLRSLLMTHISLSGHQVRGARNAIELAQLFRKETPDILFLDLSLPGESGFVVAERYRDTPKLTMVMLTGRSAMEDRIQGLEAGADLFLTKPVSLREVDAVIKRTSERRAVAEPGRQTWRLGTQVRCLFTPGGEKIPLTVTEYRLLNAMVRPVERVATRQEMIVHISKGDEYYDDRRLEVAMSRLRKKIQTYAMREAPIRAVRGVGYGFEEPCQIG
jgi:DNA-binding response OmpR family regulator